MDGWAPPWGGLSEEGVHQMACRWEQGEAVSVYRPKAASPMKTGANASSGVEPHGAVSSCVGTRGDVTGVPFVPPTTQTRAYHFTLRYPVTMTAINQGKINGVRLAPEGQEGHLLNLNTESAV